VKHNEPRHIGKRDTAVVVALALCGFGAAAASAAEFDYGAGYAAEHSDNITRVATNTQSDWIHSLLAGFAYQERSADLIAHVLAQATYNTYQNKTYGDEKLFDMNSYAVWTVSPQRFFWTVQDDYQQGLIDSTGVDTPTNRTNLNVLSTGPDLYVRLAPVHTLAFGARVGDIYTGRANVDNRRVTGTAAWMYALSSHTTLSLNYQALAVKYDDPALNDDFTTQDTFFRTQYRPSRSQFTLDLGESRVNFDRGEDLRGTLARMSWNRELTPESNVGASYSKQFLNTGTAVLEAAAMNVATGTPPAPSGIPTGVITADVYRSQGGIVYYNRRSTAFGLQFQAGRRQLDYVTVPLDSKETEGRLQLSYFATAATTATLYTDYTRTQYLDFVRRDIDRNTGLRLDHRLTATVSVAVQGSRTQRDSTDPALSYVDNRVLLFVLYRSGPLFAPLHGR
jgi:hypothetical protein